LRIVPFAEFGGKLQKPGEAVGALEVRAAFGADIGGFLGDVFRSEVAAQRFSAWDANGAFGKRAQETDQQPVAMNGRVPVKTAEECGRQFARRGYVGIAIERVAELVGYSLATQARARLAKRSAAWESKLAEAAAV